MAFDGQLSRPAAEPETGLKPHLTARAGKTAWRNSERSSGLLRDNFFSARSYLVVSMALPLAPIPRAVVRSAGRENERKDENKNNGSDADDGVGSGQRGHRWRAGQARDQSPQHVLRPRPGLRRPQEHDAGNVVKTHEHAGDFKEW